MNTMSSIAGASKDGLDNTSGLSFFVNLVDAFVHPDDSVLYSLKVWVNENHDVLFSIAFDYFGSDHEAVDVGAGLGNVTVALEVVAEGADNVVLGDGDREDEDTSGFTRSHVSQLNITEDRELTILEGLERLIFLHQ